MNNKFLRRTEYNLAGINNRIRDYNGEQKHVALNIVEQLISENPDEIYLNFYDVKPYCVESELFITHIWESLLYVKKVRFYCKYLESQEELINHYLNFKDKLNSFYDKEMNIIILKQY